MENNLSLMEQAIASLVADGIVSRADAEILLNNDNFQQNLFGFLIFEEIAISDFLEQLAGRLIQQNSVFQKRINFVNVDFQEKVKFQVTRQALFTKSQMKLLLSAYREPFWKRFLFYCSCGILSTLAGFGIFYIYQTIGG